MMMKNLLLFLFLYFYKNHITLLKRTLKSDPSAYLNHIQYGHTSLNLNYYLNSYGKILIRESLCQSKTPPFACLFHSFSSPSVLSVFPAPVTPTLKGTHYQLSLEVKLYHTSSSVRHSESLSCLYTLILTGWVFS